jgi:pyruvate/2-oxoacid:ferredoxin oxidoreductase alpha subunit
VTAAVRRLVAPYGATYDGAIDLAALRATHQTVYPERTRVTVDGNTAAAIPFLQWARSPIAAGYPITPATKWLEHLAAEAPKRRKLLKLLESEHAAADYVTGVAASCRALVVGTATSSVGLDHMTESLRSLGASGLGNVVVIDVCRATANYPLCIEGDPSDALAHRDDGFIQVMCRGRQQIYDTILQLPAVGMHPEVLTPTMPCYYGIKDSHRSGNLIVEPDDAVNELLEEALTLGGARPPGLLDGDTSMGNCVTSAWFQAFKVAQKRRQQRALEVMAAVARLFERRFGRPGLEPFELHGVDGAEVALVTMGPDAGTALQIRETLERELRTRIGLVVVRLLSPFPSEALAGVLAHVQAVGVVNNAHHHGRGHLTLDVADALSNAARRVPPIESFFCGLGGADVSIDTWTAIAKLTCQAAERGRPARPWHILHEGVDVAGEGA